MINNYEVLIEKISRASGLGKEEIEAQVDAKRNKLSGLVSKEGAAQIVAAELGISFENEKVKIAELTEGTKRANVLGKVTKILPTREFNKNGNAGKVASFFMGDESASIRVVLWDTNHISLLDEGKIAENNVVEIRNANVRNGELHLSGFSDIKLSTEKIEGVKAAGELVAGKIKDAKAGQNMKIRAVIVQVFEPRYFESKDESKEKRALMNVILDDGTETIRAVAFGDTINSLGLTNEEIFSLELFSKKKEEIIGEEKIFTGTFKVNSFFQNLEMNINKVSDVELPSLLEEFQKSSFKA